MKTARVGVSRDSVCLLVAWLTTLLLVEDVTHHIVCSELVLPSNNLRLLIQVPDYLTFRTNRWELVETVE